MQATDVTRHSRITQQLVPSTTPLSFVCCSQFACKTKLLMTFGTTLVYCLSCFILRLIEGCVSFSFLHTSIILIDATLYPGCWHYPCHLSDCDIFGCGRTTYLRRRTAVSPLIQPCSGVTVGSPRPVMKRKLTAKTLLGRIVGILLPSIVSQALPFICLWTSDAYKCTLSCNFCSYLSVCGRLFKDWKFNASLCRVSIVSLPSVPQWLGIHWKTIFPPFVINWLDSSLVLTARIVAGCGRTHCRLGVSKEYGSCFVRIKRGQTYFCLIYSPYLCHEMCGLFSKGNFTAQSSRAAEPSNCGLFVRIG